MNSVIWALCWAELQVPSLGSSQCIPRMFPGSPPCCASDCAPDSPEPCFCSTNTSPELFPAPRALPSSNSTLRKRKNSMPFFFFSKKPKLFSPQNSHKNLLHLSYLQSPPEVCLAWEEPNTFICVTKDQVHHLDWNQGLLNHTTQATAPLALIWQKRAQK